VPDRQWLANELASRAPRQPTVLVTHRPLQHSEDPGGTVDSFYAELLSRHPVTLLIHGHLEEFRYYRSYGTPAIQCSSFDKTGLHVIVTLGAQLLVERCRGDQCDRAVMEERDS